ncbi:4Fe-4S binding protein [Mediterraneibacter sp. 210702-DFI.3.120]|nr:4Fe-4S binding protein [Lachnospiraceae bacterium 210521-DFI.3.107]MCB6485584.1 4Fe-4S binding protein [Mediterraneibacter sp. 210702-DFI.3.120]
MINSISTSSETDKSKCTFCMRCVSICPVHSY